MPETNLYGAYGGSTDIFGNELRKVPQFGGNELGNSSATSNFDNVKPHVKQLCADFVDSNEVKPKTVVLPWTNTGLKFVGFSVEGYGLFTLDVIYEPKNDAIEVR